jgi:hypothetical protein
MEKDEIIYKEFIGEVNKNNNSRQLNLEETHNLVCNKQHEVSYAHDAVMDVIYTKSIFNILSITIGPRNLVRKCM